MYVGRIDTARANIQQGNVVGAAYQRDGSRLMREQILPAATTLYRHAARGLDDNYRAGTSTNEIVFVVVAGVLVLLLLLGVQLFVTHRTNRILNVGLVGARVLIIVMLVWTVTRFTSEQDALVRAQRNGSDQMQVLSAARFLTLRAQSDDNLAHVERSAGDTYLEDFDTFSARLGGRDGTGGLLGDARTIARRTGSQDDIRRLSAQFAAFRDEHDQVREARRGRGLRERRRTLDQTGGHGIPRARRGIDAPDHPSPPAPRRRRRPCTGRLRRSGDRDPAPDRARGSARADWSRAQNRGIPMITRRAMAVVMLLLSCAGVLSACTSSDDSATGRTLHALRPAS